MLGSGLVGQINPEVTSTYHSDPRDFGLEDFLESQGIE
jgi:hypothetical protein